MDYQRILNEIAGELSSFDDKGLVADYIPALAKVDPEKFAMHICTIDGRNFGIGHCSEKFSIQSISKVLSLAMAFEFEGEALWKRVGVEPSGNAFNSLLQLEYENGIPRNPLINAGAIVISDILNSRLKNPTKDFLNYVRKISGESKIAYNHSVAASEKQHGYRNSALANLMKSFGNIENDIDLILDFYFHQCSIEMNCKELAKTFLFFANHGMIRDQIKKLSVQVKQNG